MGSNPRYLLDTSTFLWASVGASQLSPTARLLISDPTAELLVSFASIWEMQIKHSLNKLPLPLPANTFAAEALKQLKAEVLFPTLAHLGALYQLPNHHRDPFDRLIIAQALTENMPLISPDAMLSKYPLQVLW